jgi:hypothetical protein
VTSNGIGTLGERSLHAALKDWYAQPGDWQEVGVDGYVVDIVRGDLLIEIQTGNFSALKRKLAALVADHPVRLVYPVVAQRWIVRVDAAGEPISRRKSPRRGRVEDLFAELVRIPTLLAEPNFSIEVALVHTEQVLRDDGQGSWRRKGWSVADRRLIEVVGAARFDTPDDLVALLPETLPDPFTNRDLARALNIRINLAQKMTYCLRKMRVIAIVGKQGNALLHGIGDQRMEEAL